MLHLFIWWQSAILFAICAPSDITKTEKTNEERLNRIPTKEDVTNDVLAANTIQFIHRLLTNEDIKRKLDEFSMVKMRGYTPYENSTPDLLALNTATTVPPVDKMSNDLNGLQEFVNSPVPRVEVIQNAFNKRNNENGFDYENGSKVKNNSEATTHTLPYDISNQINKASNEKRDENCSILKYLIDRDILSMDRYQNLQYDSNFKENGFRGRAVRRYKDPHYVTKKYESYALSLEYEENDDSENIDKAKRKSWSDAISPSDKESYNDDTYYTEGNSYQNELNEVLKKQQDLVEKLALRVEEKKNIKRSEQDFEVLLEELAEKKEEEKRRTTTTTTPKPIRMLPTIRTMIDETEVRLALKNDPFVQRIIKMANRKKQKYFQNVKKHQTEVIDEREPLRLSSDDTDN